MALGFAFDSHGRLDSAERAHVAVRDGKENKVGQDEPVRFEYYDVVAHQEESRKEDCASPTHCSDVAVASQDQARDAATVPSNGIKEVENSLNYENVPAFVVIDTREKLYRIVDGQAGPANKCEEENVEERQEQPIGHLEAGLGLPPVRG